MSGDRAGARGSGQGAVFERPWSGAAKDVTRALDVVPQRGLTSREVRQRRRLHGPNRLRETRRRSDWRILWDQLASRIVALLAAASAVAFAFGEAVEGFVIGAVIPLNALIGFVTERRALRSMEALRRLGRVDSTVRRGGVARTVPAESLVPGDVVLLEAGDVLSADLRIVEASNLQADESTLTGESLPVDKGAEPSPSDAPLGERGCMLYNGTAITRGSGEGVVVATGMATELGHISALVEEAEPETTPLEKRLEALARRLIGLTAVIVTGVAVAGILAGRPLYLAIEIAIALAVATVPEGLPIVATVALARGMWRMARRNALVEQLTAVEALGSTGIILTDKTGTLTENRMTVARIHLVDSEISVEGTGLATTGRFTMAGAPVAPGESPLLLDALRIAALCNNASLEMASGDAPPVTTGDPTEVALLVAAAKAGLVRAEILAAYEEVGELAFDPESKRMATLHRDPKGGVCAAVKGAPEAIIACCSQVRTPAGLAPCGEPEREQWTAAAEEMALRGERVLALAARNVPSVEVFEYADLELVALLGLVDPPRERVREAIDACRAAGIRVVMVTGDHAATARTVAGAVGLIEALPAEGPQLVDGRELPESLTDLPEEQVAALLEAPIIARATPRQKLDLITLHQKQGAIVAMTGDGVNDAPALKKADIGVAMGQRGTQVAREAADMVLQDDELSTIVAAVAQGRAIFANIRRFVVYLMSCNVSEIFAVGAASLVQGPLPLLPLQILFLNLVTDVFPALALGVGEGGPELMKQPPRDPAEAVVTPRDWRTIFGLGAAIAAAVLAALALAVLVFGMSSSRATTVSFLTLSFAQLWHVFSMRDPGSHWLRNEVTRNPWVWAALLLCIGLILVAVYFPPLAGVLSLEDPGADGWGLAAGMSLAPLMAGQIVLLQRARVAKAQ